jgi:hypothetical protein
MDKRARVSAHVRAVAVYITSVLSSVHLVLFLLGLSWLPVSAVLVVPALSWVAELLLWRKEGRRDLLHHVLGLLGLLLCVWADQTLPIALLLFDSTTVVVEEKVERPLIALVYFFVVRLVYYPVVCCWALAQASSPVTRGAWLVWLLFSSTAHLQAFRARYSIAPF